MSTNKKSNFLSSKDFKAIDSFAKSNGYVDASEYILQIHKDNEKSLKKPKAYRRNIKAKDETIHKTKMGSIINGDSLNWLHDPKNKHKVDLIMTSPPFGLNSKKSYGNELASDYCEWFRPFAEGFSKALSDNGSLVIDICGTWRKNAPVRSLYHFELLQMLCKEYGFFLCQEHYWWNPSKLPAPASWVTKERSRVKDSINCIWWLSKSPNPKASNRNVLGPYSNDMLKLLKQTDLPKTIRPSGHDISKKFGIDNGGSIPPNLLAIANTDSKSFYIQYCKKNNLKIHPARFPAGLPDYFIRFLTEKNDLVVDPFGGSSMTGYVSEKLDRKWVSIELDHELASTGIGRFLDTKPYTKLKSKYEIYSPCQGPDIDEN